MRQPPITVRPVTEADAEPLHRFMVRIVSERLPVLYERSAAPSIEEEREFIRATGQNSGSAIFVAISEGKIVGVLDFHREKRQQTAHGGSFGMSVSKECRSQGIGTLLLEALISWALTQGISRLELQVFENNRSAIRLYERMGFQHEGRRRRAIVVNDKKIDSLLMALELTQ